jgi:predicted ATPase
VIRRLYINNYRGLDNFELSIAGQSSVLLIGKNGSGKSTVGRALEILRKIARGTSRVGDLVGLDDLTRGRANAHMRFEIEVDLQGEVYEYVVAFELSEDFRELCLFEESLSVGGRSLYARRIAQAGLTRDDRVKQAVAVPPVQQMELDATAVSLPAEFRLDWHLVVLPIIQEWSQEPLSIFKGWLARMIIIAPIPDLIIGDSTSETLQPGRWVTDLGGWYSGLLAVEPQARAQIDGYLKLVLHDFKEIQNSVNGGESQSLTVQFSTDQGNMSLPFQSLSDGEKCFVICSLVLASADAAAYRPAFCFWDEPDNYLAPDEIQHFVLDLLRAFQAGRQLIATSHNPEAIRAFPAESTFVLFRKDRLGETALRPLETLEIHGDLVDALVRGDVRQ